MNKIYTKADELSSRLRHNTRRIKAEYETNLAVLHREIDLAIPIWANSIVKTLDDVVQFAKINTNGQFFDKEGNLLRGCTETAKVIYRKD